MRVKKVNAHNLLQAGRKLSNFNAALMRRHGLPAGSVIPQKYTKNFTRAFLTSFSRRQAWLTRAMTESTRPLPSLQNRLMRKGLAGNRREANRIILAELGRLDSRRHSLSRSMLAELEGCGEGGPPKSQIELFHKINNIFQILSVQETRITREIKMQEALNPPKAGITKA